MAPPTAAASTRRNPDSNAALLEYWWLLALPPAERDEDAAWPAVARRGRRSGPGPAGELQARQVQAVPVAELAEAIEVELAQEIPLAVADRRLAQVDHRRCRGLVVGHPGQQE